MRKGGRTDPAGGNPLYGGPLLLRVFWSAKYVDDIAAMQRELDRLVGNGTQDEIFKHYGLTPNASLHAEK